MTSSDIASLLARVREAQGPDRDIDVSITDLVGSTLIPFMEDPHGWLTKIGGKWVEATRFGHGHFTGSDRYVPHYTSSLDAIVALIERELPGTVWSINTDFEGYCAGYVATTDQSFTEQCETPALGLCAAFLSALSTKLSEAAE